MNEDKMSSLSDVMMRMLTTTKAEVSAASGLEVEVVIGILIPQEGATGCLLGATIQPTAQNLMPLMHTISTSLQEQGAQVGTPH